MRVTSWSMLGVVLMAVALTGCTVRTRPAVSYVEVTSAPVDVSTYPRAYYEGREVYYVDGRWMYPEGGRWVYYVEEPAPLYRRSTAWTPGPISRTAPRSRRASC